MSKDGRAAHFGMIAGISTNSSTDRFVRSGHRIAQPRFDPLPEGADFLRGLAARRMFADRKAGAQRVLVVVAHHDKGLGHDLGGIERRLGAERVFGAGKARRGPDRRLVQDVGERLAARP